VTLSKNLQNPSKNKKVERDETMKKKVAQLFLSTTLTFLLAWVLY